MGHACKTVGKWLVIAAMTSAFGGHWAMLQSVAWTTMIFANARHANLGQALEQTFDGRHPCALCKTIEKNRNSQKQQDMQAAMGKIDFFYQPITVALFSPRQNAQRWPHDTFALNFSSRPLLRPPRSFPG